MPTPQPVISSLAAAARGLAYLALWWLAFRRLSQPVYHFLTAHDQAIAQAFERARHGQFGLIVQWVNDLVLLLMAAAIAAVLVATEQRTQRRPAVRVFQQRCNLDGNGRTVRLRATGVAAGLLSNAAIVALIALLGGARIGLVPVAWVTAVSGLFRLVLSDGLVAFTEEFIFRGYGLSALSEGLGFWPAALINSVLFGVLHLYGADTVLGIVPVVLFAIVLCLTVRLTGSLYLAVGWHAAWDFSQDGIFGVSDSGFSKTGLIFQTVAQGPAWLSGGAIGSEGSVVTWLFLIALITTAARRPTPRLLGRGLTT